MILGPRVVIAGTSSGVGKTTMATGLMAALRRRGLTVAPAKVGPDFIDPGYHSLATGRPGRNLDPWLCGEAAIPALAGQPSQDADVMVVEGVMGMFDGAGSTPEGSTAHVARLLDAPVVLVVDASAMSGSVAALVHGYATFDPGIRLAGVILNRVGSEGHATLLREALAPGGTPVLGALRRDDALTWRDRHLGLVPVVEHPAEAAAALERLAGLVETAVDIDAVLDLARRAPRTTVATLPAAQRVGSCRLAVAAGPAFSFTYPDNLERLTEAGAELLPFDPLTAASLPEGADGLIAGGGFPEVFAPALADNQPLLDDVRAKINNGLVTWAECGGLLWLTRSLDGHPLCGVVPAEGHMTDRLSLGYRTATVRTATPLAPTGSVVRGHEFHYSTVEPAGDALEMEGRFGKGTAGWASPTLLASYLHVHLGAAPQLAENLVSASTSRRRAQASHTSTKRV